MIGRLLLAELLACAERRGLREVWGNVARDNTRMREMATAFGFASHDLARVFVANTFPKDPRSADRA